MACTLVQICESDGLPGSICKKCHDNLEVAYNFKMQCESTDNQLRQILNLPMNPSCMENRKEYSHIHYTNIGYFHKSELTGENSASFNINKKSVLSSSDRKPNIDNIIGTNDLNNKLHNREYNEITININRTQESDIAIANSSDNQLESVKPLKLNSTNQPKTYENDRIEANEEGKCELCGKLFKSKKHRIQHKRIHNQKKNHECKICHHKFASHSHLLMHLRVHSGEKPFICQVCGKGFMQSSGLTIHMRSHTGERPFKCDICNKSFTQSSNLLLHKKIHSGQREYVCQTCQKAFKFSKHLQSHMKLHTGIKDFTCNICHKGFNRKSYLKIHMSIHRGDRPHKCSFCGHGFSNSSNLTAHIRIHTGSKPFECPVCKKSFAQSSALNRHMLQHS
ncbi:zinc finger protein OZF-like [Ctenocephalides felis]|uniref:zinc finger protein OZF-like n=1 Tax=Ctenocephalides felis TaxID=7515 RepID=UPI000E6E1341|nr:zinc finger protein OZF-like [Ctenocephalides felis]